MRQRLPCAARSHCVCSGSLPGPELMVHMCTQGCVCVYMCILHMCVHTFPRGWQLLSPLGAGSTEDRPPSAGRSGEHPQQCLPRFPTWASMPEHTAWTRLRQSEKRVPSVRTEGSEGLQSSSAGGTSRDTAKLSTQALGSGSGRISSGCLHPLSSSRPAPRPQSFPSAGLVRSRASPLCDN